MNNLFSEDLFLSQACQRLLQIGLNALIASTILLLVALIAVRYTVRHAPAPTLLIYQSALGGAAFCILFASLFAGRAVGIWTLPLPSVQAVEAQTAPLATQGNTWKPENSTFNALERRIDDADRQPAAINNVPVRTASADTSSASGKAAVLPPFVGFLTSDSKTELSNVSRVYIVTGGLWLLVTAVLLMWLGACYAGIYLLRKRALPVEDPDMHRCLQAICAAQNIPVPALLSSRDVDSVFLAGILRPAILLPVNWKNEWDTDTLEAILIHEVAHMSAREGWWTLLTRILCAVFWMQPLLWQCCRRREQAAEEVCDQAVLQRGHVPSEYAHCLITLAEQLTPSRWERTAGSGSVVFRSSLAQRIRRILDGTVEKARPVSMGRRLVIGMSGSLLALCLSLAVAATPKQMDSSLDDNPQLNQKVKITAEGVPMSALLALITQKTGLQIKADSYTADDKIIVFGPPRPLKNIMTDMAALFNDTWLHSKNGEQHTYRLTRNPRERDYEERLTGEMNRRLLAQMDAQIRALGETQDELKKRPENDSIRKALSSPQGRNATSIFALLTQAQRMQLLEQWQVTLPVSALSSAQKDGIEPLFHGALFDQEAAPGAPSAGVPVTQIPREQMDQHEITFMVLKASGVNRQSTGMSIFLTAPSGLNMPALEISTEARFVLPAHNNPYTGNKGRVSDLPTMQGAAITGGEWVERLRALAEKTGQPVLSDFYRSKSVVVPEADEKSAADLPAVQALDTICRPEGYLWWNRGKTLLARKRDWYNQQLYEVPDRWIMEQARRLQQHKGILTGTDVLSLQDLTTNQIAGLNESLGKPADRRTLMGLRELLAVVAACPFDKDVSLYKGKIGREVMPHQVAIMPDLKDPQQQRLMHNFLLAFPRKIMPKDITPGDFGFIIIPSWRDPKNASDPGAASADILLYTGKDGMGAGFQVALPLALPDNRLSKTRVEINL